MMTVFRSCFPGGIYSLFERSEFEGIGRKSIGSSIIQSYQTSRPSFASGKQRRNCNTFHFAALSNHVTHVTILFLMNCVMIFKRGFKNLRIKKQDPFTVDAEIVAEMFQMQQLELQCRKSLKHNSHESFYQTFTNRCPRMNSHSTGIC